MVRVSRLESPGARVNALGWRPPKRIRAAVEAVGFLFDVAKVASAVIVLGETIHLWNLL